MRKLAFIVSLIGIFVLLGFFMLPAQIITNSNDILELKLNTKVILVGTVDSERAYGDFRILSIQGVTVTCNCLESYLGKKVEILGVVENYEKKKQIEILRIKNLS